MKKSCLRLTRIPIAATIALILLGSIIPAEDARSQIQPPSDTPVATGRELFIENRCANCHTIGRGRFVGPDLARVNERYSKEEIKQWMQNSQSIYSSLGKMPVNEGYPPMPPMNVSEPVSEAIADWLVSVNPDDLPKARKGVIRGKITSQAKGEAAAGIGLKLTAFLGDNPTDEKTAATDSDGTFEFANLAWDRAYTVALNYKGTEYVTDRMIFYPDEDTKKLDLPIYETTDSDDNIGINAGHMIVQVSDEEIAVVEIFILNNSGSDVFIGKTVGGDGGERRSLRFELPKGADNVEFLEGLNPETIVKDIGGFSDSSAFSPGVRRMVFGYKLPYRAGKNLIETKLNYPAKGFILLVSNTGANLKVDGLEGGDLVNFDNSRFFRWSGKDIAPGSKIRLEIGKSYVAGDWIKWAVVGALILLVGGAASYSFLGNRRNEEVSLPSQPQQKEDGLGKDIRAERANLISLLAELDDKFEAGDMADEEYRKLRNEYKEKLIEITNKINNKT